MANDNHINSHFNQKKGGDSMKFTKNRLANALALATTVFWVACSAIVWVFPAFSMQITTWWMHGLDMSVMGDWNLNLNNFLLGGISAVISAWASGWVLGWSWEQVSKK